MPENESDTVEKADGKQAPSLARSFALNGLFLLAVFYTLFFMRSLLLPIVLALLLSYLLVPLVRILARWRIPSLLGAGLVVGGLLVAVSLGIGQLGEPAAKLIAKAPETLRLMKERIRPFQEPINQVKEASMSLDELTGPGEKPEAQSVQVVEAESVGAVILSQTPSFLTSAICMLILLYFMLAYNGLLLNKTVQAIPSFQNKKHAVGIAREVERAISKYLLTVMGINICLGCAVGVAMWLLGFPSPVLWGVFAGLLNFVPYLGGIVGIVTMTAFAIISFDTLGEAVFFPLAYLAINTLEGSFLTPMIMGRSFTLNPIAVVMGLLFWGWLWGIAGMILAVPILVTFKIVCDHVSELEPVSEFLSG